MEVLYGAPGSKVHFEQLTTSHCSADEPCEDEITVVVVVVVGVSDDVEGVVVVVVAVVEELLRTSYAVLDKSSDSACLRQGPVDYPRLRLRPPRCYLGRLRPVV